MTKDIETRNSISDIVVIKKDKTKERFDINKTIKAIELSAKRIRFYNSPNNYALTNEERKLLSDGIQDDVEQLSKNKKIVNVNDIHKIVENNTMRICPDVYKSYSDYRNYKSEMAKEYIKLNDIAIDNMNVRNYDNANSDNTTAVNKKMQSASFLETSRMENFYLTSQEKEDTKFGRYYVHDKADRLIYPNNCCLFDMEQLFLNYLEINSFKYVQPNKIISATNELSDLILCASAQQYGGFTVCRVDNLLAPYMEMNFYSMVASNINNDLVYFEQQEKTCKIFVKDILDKNPNLDPTLLLNILNKNKNILKYNKEDAIKIIIKTYEESWNEVCKLLRQGIQGIEYKVNTVSSSRGDFPFISFTFGLGTSIFEKEVSKAIMEVRKKGQGPKNFEQTASFPKLIFLFDKDLHSKGCYNYDLFLDAIDCSHLAMYPDYLSLTGNDNSVTLPYKRYIDEVRVFEKGGRLSDGKIVKPYKFKIYMSYKELSKIESKETMELLDETILSIAKYKISKKIIDTSIIAKLKSNLNKYNEVDSKLNKTGQITPELILQCVKENDPIVNGIELEAKKKLWPIPAVSPMGCRSFLGEFYEHIDCKKSIYYTIKEVKNDPDCKIIDYNNKLFTKNNITYTYDKENHFYPMYSNVKKDLPIYEGRFNIGVVSLNLPLIFEEAKTSDINFFTLLDETLNKIRNFHLRTAMYVSKMKCSINPFGFIYGGYIRQAQNKNSKINIDMCSASFGITALNELQLLYNGKSIKQEYEKYLSLDKPIGETKMLIDPEKFNYTPDENIFFALEVVKFIYNKVNEFKKEDKLGYAIYGTPAEKLCGTQAVQFENAFGQFNALPNHPTYFSNSFHCHVSEDISAVEKQNYENIMWPYFAGGKIQYCRHDLPYNTQGIKTIVERAMELGFYEGVNIDESYCNNCGTKLHLTGLNQKIIAGKTKCPKCGSIKLTVYNRNCGYRSKVGDIRTDEEAKEYTGTVNEAKLAEILDRVSM